MKLVIHWYILRKVVHEKLLDGIIRVVLLYKTMATEKSPGVCVNHKNRFFQRIEKDAVGSLGANSVQIQESFS